MSMESGGGELKKTQAQRNEALRGNRDEAQEYANMVNAKARLSPDDAVRASIQMELDDSYFREDVKITEKDYEEAITAVDELIVLAEQEPTYEKVISLLKRIPQPVRDYLYVLAYGMIDMDKHHENKERFKSINTRLKELKKRAKAFEDPYETKKDYNNPITS